jgi:phosphatidylglycerophosphate synthase
VARARLATGAAEVRTAYATARSAASRTLTARSPAVAAVDRHGHRLAREMLLRSMRKPIDGLVSRTLNRPVSLTMTRFWVQTPITPNQLTVLTFLTALAGAAVMATASPETRYWHFALGATILQFASILDGCDGEVARLKYQCSKLGSWMDTVFDDISNQVFAAATGLGMVLGYADREPWNWVLGGLCWLGVACAVPAIIATYRKLGQGGASDSGSIDWQGSPDASAFRRFLTVYLQPVVKRDGYYFVFFLCAILGAPWLIAVLFFLGAAMVAGTVLTDRGDYSKPA